MPAAAARNGRRAFRWPLRLALQFALTYIDARFRDDFLACAATPCPAPNMPVACGHAHSRRAARHARMPRCTGAAIAGWHARVDGQYVGAVPVEQLR